MGGHRAGKGGGEVFDVLVTAFDGGPARSLQGLREVFGLEGQAAERLLASLPVIVKHAAPANEAQNYLQLLRGIGAEVELSPVSPKGSAAHGGGVPPPVPAAASRRVGEPPPLPWVAPPTAVRQAPRPPPWPPSAGAAPYRLPRPIVRTASQDLEFDLGASPGQSDSALVPSHESRMERAGGEDPPPPPPFAAAGRPLRMPFDFEQPTAGARLELAVEPIAVAMQPGSVGHARPPDEASRPRSARNSIGAGARRAGGLRSRDPAGAARVELATNLAVPGRAAVDRGASRPSRAWWRVLAALTIAGLGLWFDNSIAFGNANSFGVLAHAVAIYQLGLGLRSFTPW